LPNTYVQFVFDRNWLKNIKILHKCARPDGAAKLCGNAPLAWRPKAMNDTLYHQVIANNLWRSSAAQAHTP